MKTQLAKTRVELGETDADRPDIQAVIDANWDE